MDSETGQGKSVAVYLCNECKKTQNIVFTPKRKKEFILDDPDFQARGLALYSHTHMCKYGILGTNSLFIDHNMHVRSYNYVNLPKYKIKKKVSIPMPGKPKIGGASEVGTRLEVTHVRDKNDLNITLYNEYSEALLIIGKPDLVNSAPTKTLVSSMGSMTLKYYYSDTRYTSQVELWLLSLINNFEILPPSQLGLVLEVLNLILDEKDSFPSDFDDMIIKTILASHEIYFEFSESDGTESLNAYGVTEAMTMKEILRICQDEPMKPLHEFSLVLQEDIVLVIYCFLILEKHGFLIIHRPGILTTDLLSLDF